MNPSPAEPCRRLLLTLIVLSLAGLVASAGTSCRRQSPRRPEKEAPAPGEREAPRPVSDGTVSRAEAIALEIPTRDGQRLAADLWLPRPTGRFPTILVMTPYNRKNLGRALPDPQLEVQLPDRESYAMVVVDWRGFFGSKAAKRGAGGLPQQGRDGYDVVEWIARQEWSDGKVGMWGPSGLGRVQYSVAAENPPHLEAIAPLVAADGFSYEIFYYGGVLKKGYVDMLGVVGFGSQRRVRANPVDNEFWRQVERTTRHTKGIRVPVMMLTGWYDLSVETVVATFTELRNHGSPVTRANIRLWIGPWHHTAVGSREQGELEFPAAERVGVAVSNRFFDSTLRGLENGWSTDPLVAYFRMGHDSWHTADTFPPPPAGASRYYLRAGGELSSSPPEESEGGSASYLYDPRDPSPTIGGMNAFIGADPKSRTVGAGPRDNRAVEDRADCLVFSTPALRADVVLEGRARVKLFVASDRVDTDFAVRLTDVYPDGRSMLISDGIQRARFRDGATPRLLEPGEIYEIDVTLSMTAHAFRAGHRIRVIVSSSNSPRFEPNPNVDRPRLLGPKHLVATNRIYFDRRQPSVVELPRWAGVEPMDRALLEAIGVDPD